MKNLISFFILIFLTACQPSDLDKCLEFNIQNLNKDYPRGNLLNELDKPDPDLNLINQYFDELNLYYGSYELQWMKGLPLNKEEYIKLVKSDPNTFGSFCLVFDFNEFDDYLDCIKKYGEDKFAELSEDEQFKLYKKEIKKTLNISYKGFQEGISGQIFETNHLEEISGMKSKKSFFKQPEDMILSDYLEFLSMALKDNKQLIDGYKFKLQNDSNKFIKTVYENQLKISHNRNLFAFRFINSSIDSGNPKKALEICNAQGIY